MRVLTGVISESYWSIMDTLHLTEQIVIEYLRPHQIDVSFRGFAALFFYATAPVFLLRTDYFMAAGFLKAAIKSISINSL